MRTARVSDSIWVWIGNIGAGGGQIDGNDAAAGGDEAGDHGPLGKADALVGAGEGDQGAADFRARGVAAGVENAGQRVSTFAGAEQFAGFAVEVCAPLNEFGHTDRPLGDERFGGGAIHDAVAGVYGVLKMEGNVLDRLPWRRRFHPVRSGCWTR